MTRSKIAVFKKAVQEERVRKYNHNHDEKGRFCSGDGTKVDPHEKLEHARRKAYSRVEEASKDKRLSIDNDEAKKNIDSVFNHQTASVKIDADTAQMWIEEAANLIIEKAISDYGKKSGIQQVSFNETMGISATLDFIDGVSWAKDHLGFEIEITQLSGIDRGDNVVADTTIISGQPFMTINPKYYGEDRKIDSAVDGGFNIRNCSAKSFGVHEAVHVIEADIAKKCTKIKESTTELWKNHVVAQEIAKRAHNKIGGDIEENTESVSLYALLNDSETVAECISDCYANGEDAQELSKAVLKVVKEDREDVVKTIGDKTS